MKKPATKLVHWPGKTTPACNDHVAQLKGLASVMGFPVSTTDANGEDCANCANQPEAK